MRVEFLLEEASMVNVLRELLPKILPSGYRVGENCFLRPHQGKSDLKRSIPKKMKAFSNQEVKIVILHDQDSNDCIKLKKELTELCKTNGTCPFLIRIVCRELESWYLGDMAAIEAVYPRFRAKKYFKKSKFRNPDKLGAASDELTKLVKGFQKGTSSRKIAPYLTIENNKSRSFNNFISGLQKFLDKGMLQS